MKTNEFQTRKVSLLKKGDTFTVVTNPFTWCCVSVRVVTDCHKSVILATKVVN